MSNNHVYILGAGFSVPLGGPLFTQLMTVELQHLSSDLGIPEQHRVVIAGMHLNLDNAMAPRSIDLSMGRRHRPLNAEELLEMIDWAQRNPTHRKAKLFERLLPQKPGHVYDIGAELVGVIKHLKRTIACQCQSFLTEIEDDSERLEPYLTWFKNLSSNDTIITFNYDTAIERISQLAGRQLPAKPASYQSDLPRLIKLHGSVDWYFGAGGIEHKSDAYKQDLDIAIGMPGRGKSKLTEDPTFRDLWAVASQEITNADIVSLIGYSMPATDNKARAMIVNSLAVNRNLNRRVNLVLGPDSGTVRANRIVSIMQPVIGDTLAVYDLPMFAQDYIERIHDYSYCVIPRK
jgi:hypothetical protein